MNFINNQFKSDSSKIFHIALFNIKIRFKNTYLGFIWAALEPLLYFLILYVVFTSIRNNPKEDFAIYLITGIMLYHIFSRGTTGGLSSLTSNAGIINSIGISKKTFIISSTVAIGILGLVDVGVFFGLMPFFDFIPSSSIILLPVVFGLNILLILGLSYFLSILNVFAKDIQYVWIIIVHAMLFVTPIFWYVEDVDEGILLIIQKINPLGQLIELAHHLVIFETIPPLNDWLYTSFFVLIIFFSGFLFFKKFEHRVNEEL